MNDIPSGYANAELGEARLDPDVLFRTVLRHKWWIVACLLLTTTTVMLWTIKQPRIYEARTLIEYDPNPPRPLAKDIQGVADPVGNFWASQEFFETQNKIISSRTVAERVVKQLNLHEDPDFARVPEDAREQWQGLSVEQAASILRRRITVEQVRKTRLVEVKVRDSDPDRAQQLANAVANSYISKTLEDRLSSTVEAVDWLRKRLDSAAKKLDESELALHDFKRKNNVLSVSLEDGQNIIAANIQQYSQSLTAARTRRIELSARLQQLKEGNREDPLQVNAPAIVQDETIKALREQYAKQNAELSTLRVKYGAAHPEITSREIANQRLLEHMRQKIDSVIEATEAEVREARNIEQGLKEQLDKANAAGMQLQRREIDYDRLNRERADMERLYAKLLQRTTETNLTKLLHVTHVRVVDTALRNSSPVSPNFKLNLIASLLAGLVLGIGLVFLLERLDRTIRSVEHAEALGIPVLGILPTFSDQKTSPRITLSRKKQLNDQPDPSRYLAVHEHPMSSLAECCRAIRTNLMFMSPDTPPHSLVVTSAGPREGKTTVTISLAIAMAQSAKNVLLIDTDLRRPAVHRAFGLKSNVGVTSVLIGDVSLADAIQETQVPGVFVLPCGPIPPNPAELLHTQAFAELLKQAAASFDRVLLDSPPLAAVTDAAIIAPQLDGAIVVLQAGSTRRDAARSALRQLHDVNASLLGAIVNDVDLSRPGYGYGGYYYQYYRKGDYYTATPEEIADSSASEEPKAQRPADHH